MLGQLKFDLFPEDDPRPETSSYGQFKVHMPAVVRQLLSQTAPAVEEPRPGADIRVVIVSHSGLILSKLQCGGSGRRAPSHNEVWVQMYEFEWAAWDAVLDPTGCEPLFAPTFLPTFERTDGVCSADLARCTDNDSHFMPTARLASDEEYCDIPSLTSRGPTSCIETSEKSTWRISPG